MEIVEKPGNPGQGGQRNLSRGMRGALTPILSSFHLPLWFQAEKPGSKTLMGPLVPLIEQTVRHLQYSIPLLVFLASASCSPTNPGDHPTEAIQRDLFITAYVELRVAALQAEGQELTLRDRDRVLARLGVEEADLLEFVEFHGKDVTFMRLLWEEVDSVLEGRRRPQEDRGPGG